MGNENQELERLERGWLFYVVKGLWPVGIVAALVSLLLFVGTGMVGEAIVQSLILATLLWLWPWIRKGYR
jgi:hypothetical protein